MSARVLCHSSPLLPIDLLRPRSASAPISAYGSRLSMSSRRWCAATKRSVEAPWWQDGQRPMARGLLCGDPKGWQSGWFYITELRDPEWVAAPEFRSRPPTQLTSWKETGLSWGKKGELTGLQTCVQTLVDKKLKLVNVVQVMLTRRILPCQQRAFNLWEFDPARNQTLNRLRHDVQRCLEGAFQGP